MGTDSDLHICDLYAQVDDAWDKAEATQTQEDWSELFQSEEELSAAKDLEALGLPLTEANLAIMCERRYAVWCEGYDSGLEAGTLALEQNLAPRLEVRP